MSIGIALVGLGMSPEDLTDSVRRLLSEAKEAILIEMLPPGYPEWNFNSALLTLKQVCNTHREGEDGDETCANTLLKMGIRRGGVVIAIGGDPTFSSPMIASLRKKAEGVSVPVKIYPAAGCLQHCLALSGVDAGEGLYQLNADRIIDAHHPPFSPDNYVFLQRLPQGEGLNKLVSVLQNQYPGSHRVSVFNLKSDGSFHRREKALEAVPEGAATGSVHAMLIPPMKKESSLESFQETIAHLRAEDGCPWDRKQTHQTLRLHLLEETYEALDALDRGDIPGLREELGDLLLQIVLHAQIGTENGSFQMADVIAGIQEKIIHRHPHVFGDVQVEDEVDVLTNWEVLKKTERRSKGSDASLLNGVPKGLPALAQAVEIQDRAARVGFEWEEIEGVLDKIGEEIGELKDAKTEDERNAEFGDLLFVLANYARWLKIEPESALREASTKFRARFNKLESIALKKGQDLQDLSLVEMNLIWDEVKLEEG